MNIGGMARRVVIFDLGGVVADSPIMAIRRYALERGVDDLNPWLGKSAAWASFIEGKMGPRDFPQAAYKESVQGNYQDGIQIGTKGWAGMLLAMGSGGTTNDGNGSYRPLMIRTLRRLRNAGLIVAALTNNFDTDPLPDPEEQAELDREHEKFVALFDFFIESRVVGLMKPDPNFYDYALSTIGCKGTDAIFLDDIGLNLKTAKKMGIHTILVKNDEDYTFLLAIQELQAATGVQLLDGDEPVPNTKAAL